VKFIGFRDGRQVMIGRLFDDGGVAPLAEVGEFYADLPRWSAAAGAASEASKRRVELVEAPAVPPGARVLCVGLNYRAHAAETGAAVPEHPSIFGRWTPSLVSGGTPVPVPAGEPGLDWEVELAAVVGRRLAAVDPAAAQAGVFGYAVFNDLSARRHQRHTPQWTVGKNADRTGPISAVTTADEVGDPADGLGLRTRVNGEVVQDSTTADMIFTVGEVLSYLSEVMTLQPGDVLATGTPQGVGFARTPPRYLVPGDIVEVEIDTLGTLTNPIVDTDARFD
jgi:2-keto-4-pentenoate hydratase/2-oxohepta-3-ene-1,7-dioic acid hydratase in catechol pathway